MSKAEGANFHKTIPVGAGTRRFFCMRDLLDSEKQNVRVVESIASQSHIICTDEGRMIANTVCLVHCVS
jgi:hypothetical protein